MTQKHESHPTENPTDRFLTSERRFGLKWKIIGTLVGGSLLLAIIGFVFVSHQMEQAMRRQLDQRALDIATNLSDGAAPHILGGNVLQLHALVAKYSLLNGMAYIAIRDKQGRVVAHSLGSFPPELEESLSRTNPREAGQRELDFLGRQVFETHNPILSGQVGAVHVGIWADTLDDDIRQVLLPLASIMGILLVTVTVFSFLIVQKLLQPVIQLKDIADRVSMGELETSVGIESNDEIGELALSVDRLRSSLRAAMIRLEHALANG
jgi:HAMP domain-containing protein